MSEVKRYDMCGFGGGLVERPEGAWYHMDDFDRVTAERDALQALLTAADERADVLATALSKIKLRLDAFVEADRDMPSPSVEVCQSIAYAALKPAEGRGDET